MGSFTGLQATSPATANTSISVGMSTAAAGLQSGNVVLGFVSDGTGIAGDGTKTLLSNQNVAVTGNVFRLATGSASPDPLNLGNFRLSSATATGSLDIKNSAANDGSSEQLGIQSVGASAGFTASSNLGATRINAQATSTGAVGVGLGSGLVAGINTGTVTIQYLSDGTVSGTGAPINSNSQNVNVNATGYNMAVGSTTPTPVVLNARVGDTATQALTVANTAVAGIYSEALNANFSGATGSAGHNGVA
ncbi:MAG: choice-of-anchor D domain-containing protein, partial [Propionivibrio sp.]|nr:choice-of-anchor D domain-containing protein [Propionivibrio sp.]